MKKKISIYQFFVLMTLVPYGSASLFFLAPEAKQDAWIALLVYSLAGIALQAIYISIYKKYPQDTLVVILQKLYGKFIGKILGFLYIIYFTYIASRVFRDYSEVISAFSLKSTPRVVFGSLFILVIIFSVYNGIDNVASLAQLFFLVLILAKICGFLLIFWRHETFEFYNLKPILNEGIVKVLSESWQLILFPYGETVVFTMIYPLIIENSKLKKVAIFSIITEAIILSFNCILFICTLGVNFATLTNFPLFEAYRLVKISEVLSRMDILFLLIFMIEGFFKISIFLYAAVLGAYDMLKFKNSTLLILIFGVSILVTSLLMSENYPQHVRTGLVDVLYYVHMPMEVIIPIITLIIVIIKKLITKKPNIGN
ncbi:spore germination protein KB [Clostridium zeae]|uniref:Spore germination protein KB n=1 Tax=Clostridium zeae TaxID=2759022 RepID=A0ABQ1ECR6_9CLOT|nr:GerAB/ArcD/ProY family transporter [Clostridium zeae]GFZ32590.1 spore germination protein KB [Clostridium zeae]